MSVSTAWFRRVELGAQNLGTAGTRRMFQACLRLFLLKIMCELTVLGLVGGLGVQLLLRARFVLYSYVLVERLLIGALSFKCFVLLVSGVGSTSFRRILLNQSG